MIQMINFFLVFLCDSFNPLGWELLLNEDGWSPTYNRILYDNKVKARSANYLKVFSMYSSLLIVNNLHKSWLNLNIVYALISISLSLFMLGYIQTVRISNALKRLINLNMLRYYILNIDYKCKRKPRIPFFLVTTMSLMMCLHAFSYE